VSAASWGASLPELAGVSPRAMDPGRVEAAVRDGYAAGLAAGREDGYAAGHQAGVEAARGAVDAEWARLAGAVAAVGRRLEELAGVDAAVRRAFEAHVVDAALLLAEAILDRELAVAADPGRDALVRALAVAPAGIASATVRLHPDDAARLGPVEDLAPGVELAVVADPAVEPGGCLLQCGDTAVDASVRAALERVAGVLR